MSRAFQRTSKLSDLRLTLSKYDTKYSKPSALLDEDSSDEIESIQWRPKSLDKTPTHVQTETFHLSSVDQINRVSSESGRENPTIQNDLEGQGSSVVNSVAIEQSESPSSNNVSIKQETSDQSSSSNVEENSLLETGSSIESVRTDSVLGFGNVHSVSSLAESVLPFDEGAVINPPGLFITTKVQNLSRISSSSSFPSSNRRKSEKLSNALNIKSIENPFFTQDTDGKCSEPTASLAPEQCLSATIVNKSRKSSKKEAEQNLSQQKDNVSFKLRKRFSENDQNTSFQVSEVKPTAYQGLDTNCKCDPTIHEKVSVAVQTPDYQTGRLRKSQSGQTKMRLTCTAECAARVPPVIKSTKLPRFLKDEGTIPQNILVCGQHKDTPCTVEDEISKLVNHHVHLTKEFLKRQHRMYIANCKAVKLLDKGYRENSLQSTLSTYI